MLIKIHKSYRNVVAICDSEIIGKKFYEDFERGTKQLDLHENFFKGEEKSEEEIIEIIKMEKMEDSTFNIVGEKSVNAAIKAELISEEEIQYTSGIPYALVLF